MHIVREHGRIHSQGADGDDQIGQRKTFSHAIQMPGQFFRRPPDAMVGRHMDENIKECAQAFLQFRSNDPAQHFTTHDVTADQIRPAEGLFQFERRIAALSQ